MANDRRPEPQDSTFNGWLGGATPDGPQAPRRAPAGLWRRPVQWNVRPFYACTTCGWRGEVKAAPQRQTGLPCQPPTCPSGDGAQISEARRRVASGPNTDWLTAGVPITWFLDLLDLVRRTPNLDWMMASRSIAQWQDRLLAATAAIDVDRQPELWRFVKQWLDGESIPEHVWIGADVANQADFDRQAGRLLAVPASVRYLSIRSITGPVYMLGLLPNQRTALSQLDWVIAGGDEGAAAPPAHPDWFSSIAQQCTASGVPFFFRQWGAWRPICQGDEDWYAALYRSRRLARTGEDQAVLDELWGRVCKVPQAVVHLDGTVFLDTTASGAWQQGSGAMLTFRVGARDAGRLLDGVTHDGIPHAAARRLNTLCTPQGASELEHA